MEALLELAKLAVTILAAISGWFVASRLQDQRERRKEIRSLIDEAKSLVNDCHRLTLKYYSAENTAHNGPLPAEIKLKILLISQYFLIISQAGLYVNATSEIIRFKQLATGDFFETKDFFKRNEDLEWQANFIAATNELWMLLDKRYFASFKIPGMRPHYQPHRMMRVQRVKSYRKISSAA